MIRARVLESSSTLNSFREIDSLEYITGTPFTLIVQLYDDQSGNRFIPVKKDDVKESLYQSFI